ncbi:MDR family MFS transporter [Maritalea mediterranea]|uniref:DHA2 family efflux MFS transporter permease subunit n=1 Tax=Maritalea mediterranea TaxID=2909667 RepID=A0ABS9E826_9HYPH|nr:MDR family MFS transporter [Maritalea mediterranea]MCF4099038.1 DHA2 family efflux MFS transporter permease subunit [Maritalea mediterranea]
MTDLNSAAEALPPEEAAPDHTGRNRLVIALLLISTFVVFLNETIMTVALPRLMVALDVSAGAVQWLTTAFLLTMAVVIPITGFLIQQMNTRPIFILAMSVFSVGTFVCAVSPGLELLIFGRVTQAVGTAIMMPLLMTTVMTLVPPEGRGKTMGNISIVISVAPAIGPTISGFVLNYMEWRWLFILVMPIALLALAAGSKYMKNVTEPRYAPLDILSVILSAIAFGGLVYGLSSFGGEGTVAIAGLPSWAPLVIGAVVMVIFIARQLHLQKKDSALLDFRTFQSRLYSICVGMLAISMAVLLGTVILLPIYTQNVLGIDALQTGLLLMPGGLLMGLLAPTVGRLYDRYGPRPLVIPGTLLVSAVLWALTQVGETTSIYNILIGHVVLSLGLALVFTPLFTSGLGSVPPQLYSHGSAMLGSIQQVSGAAGVALFVAVMAVQSRLASEAGLAEVPALTEGIRWAFMCGAVIYMFAVAAAWMVRRPADAREAVAAQ